MTGALMSGGLVALQPAVASASTPQVLILGDSVNGGASSTEAQQAAADGFGVTVVSGTQWDAESAADFASYQELIIGDPMCGSTSAFAAAVADQSVWEPVVQGSGGNKVVIGTDPSFHYLYGGKTGGRVLEQKGIAYAGAVAGATGAYVDLSCAYNGSPASGVALPLMDGLSSHGTGQFSVGGASASCAGAVSIVASAGPTAGLSDGDLSGWGCSVHEYITRWPSDWSVLALATDSSVPKTYAANDVGTGTTVSGSPYILISGGGIAITSNISLAPATGSAPAFTSTTLSATVVSGGAPVVGKTVTFNVDSGPNSGTTGTAVTDATGVASYTYSDTKGVGTDGVSATFIDSLGATEKATATESWTPVSVATTTSYTGPASGQVGEPVTLSANLSASAGGTAEVGKTINLTLGSQGCSGTTDASGNASCSVTLTQDPGAYTVTASFAGDGTSNASSAIAPFSINQAATSLAYNGDIVGTYAASTTLKGTLTATTSGAPLAGEQVSFTLGTQSCSALTDPTGNATCTITLSQPSGAYTVDANFAGDTDNLASSASTPYTLKPAATLVTYTGATSGTYGQSVTLSGSLTDNSGNPQVGQTLQLAVGGESCSAPTDATGTAACKVIPGDSPGTYTATAAFAGNADYAAGSDGAAFVLSPAATTLTYTGATNGNFNHSVVLSANLTDATNSALSGEAVDFTLGSQGCNAITDPSGNASCSIVVNQTPGSYTAGVSFAGNGDYLASSASAPFTLNQEPTTLTYTGATKVEYGDSGMLSATLVDSADGSAVPGETVTLTLGSQSCTAVTDAVGQAICSVAISQDPGSYTATAKFAGDSDYSSSAASTPFTILIKETATTYTGATSAVYGATVTLSGNVTDPTDGSTQDPAPIVGQPLVLTVGTQSCSATTDANGDASCSVVFTQDPGSYTVSADFAGGTDYVVSSASASFAASADTTTTFVSVAPPTVTYGAEQAATFTATVTTGNGEAVPAGELVTVDVGSASCVVTLGSASNGCQIAKSALPASASSYAVSAAYAGDADLLGSSGTTSDGLTVQSATVVQDSTSTAVSVAPSSVNYNSESAALFSATVATGNGEAVPDGESVTVNVGSAQCTATLASGSGSCSIADNALPASASAYTVTAAYSGDTNLKASGAAATTGLTVNPATPSISWANPADITYGTPLSAVQLDATSPVAGAFTYSPPAGTVLTVGYAETLSVSFLPTDTTDYTTAAAAASLNVVQAVPALTVTGSEPAVAGNDVSYTVTASPVGQGAAPTGSVHVTDGAGGSCSVTLSSGSGTCPIQEDAAGTYQVVASYSGDHNYTAGTPATNTEAVGIATPALSLSGANPVAAGGSATYSVIVSGNGSAPTPTGTVKIVDNLGDVCTVTLSAGSGSCSIPQDTAGAYVLTATYSGNANYSSGPHASLTFNVGQEGCVAAAAPAGQNLAGANLAGKNLKGVNYQNANLQGANLKGANLMDANLSGADLQGANLQGANLMGANLKNANFTGGNLQGDNMQGDDATCAVFTNANLAGDNLQGLNGTGASLQGANLQGANLQNGVYAGATFHGDNLQGDNLQKSNLVGVDLGGANLTGDNLQGDDFTAAVLKGATTSGANLKGDVWSNTTCGDATNSNADGGSCTGHM